jgi:hypothetical protein
MKRLGDSSERRWEFKGWVTLGTKGLKVGLRGNLADAGTASYLNFFILAFPKGMASFFSARLCCGGKLIMRAAVSVGLV